jgi:hypothetical protein
MPLSVWLLYQATRLIPVFMLVTAVAATALVVAHGMAYAAEGDPPPGGPESIQQVANNIRTWLVGILVAVATLFLTVGGLRYLAANGDPGELEKAKLALRSAVIGYALALLAPLFVTIVGEWVA